MNSPYKFESTTEKLANELASSILETIQMLTEIVRASDKYYNGSHSKFVADKSAEIAVNLGFSAGEVFEIRAAGLLHDIGKIGYPEFLMAKHPQDLPPNDFQFYTNHVEDGHRILSIHQGLTSIAQIVYQHHERYDGSGFPKKLRRDEIHRGALIISVVDYYHNAMERTTREKSSHQASAQITNTSTYLNSTHQRFAQTMNYLHQRSGSTFDPEIVDNFKAIIEADRKSLGDKTILRLSVNQLKPGMVFASDYHSSYGLLIAALGETISEVSVQRLISLAEVGEIPQKILVMK